MQCDYCLGSAKTYSWRFFGMIQGHAFLLDKCARESEKEKHALTFIDRMAAVWNQGMSNMAARRQMGCCRRSLSWFGERCKKRKEARGIFGHFSYIEHVICLNQY